MQCNFNTVCERKEGQSLKDALQKRACVVVQNVTARIILNVPLEKSISMLFYFTHLNRINSLCSWQTKVTYLSTCVQICPLPCDARLNICNEMSLSISWKSTWRTQLSKVTSHNKVIIRTLR